MELTILFEDANLLVVDKPAGITVNKSETTLHEVTVQDWAEKKLEIGSAKLGDEEESDFYNRGGIVHRLDKETSGILLIAKTEHAFATLQRQFKERTVKKTYLALAHGHIVPQEGEIRVPVGRLPWNRKRFGIIAGGRESVTKYKTISHFKFPISSKQNSKDEFTLVELYPETGRTHQIRVHLKHIGHPIFADFLYAGRKTARSDRRLLLRVFLHAAGISFVHPVSGKLSSFESPLPKELQDIIATLQQI